MSAPLPIRDRDQIGLRPRPRPLVVTTASGQSHLLAAITQTDAIWFDIDRDVPPDGTDVSAVIVDVPINAANNAKRVAELLSLFPNALPKLFVVDKGQRIEVVRANVLGATELTRRPLNAVDLHNFLGSVKKSKAVPSPDSQRVAALVSVALTNMFDAFLNEEDLNTSALDNAGDAIASTIAHTGLERWLDTVREHHRGTLQHCLIVSGVMTRFGQRLGMSDADIRTMTRIGILHDVGKAAIPTEVLDKPGRLTVDEFSLIKTHPNHGFSFLSTQRSVGASELASVVGHHEYLDGSGYPYGLMESSIGDFVRITTVCDIYSALVERRSYKSEMSTMDALDILRKMASEGKIELALVRAFAQGFD